MHVRVNLNPKLLRSGTASEGNVTLCVEHHVCERGHTASDIHNDVVSVVDAEG
jgi:hypothetical protein